jgi:hypothetical protein
MRVIDLDTGDTVSAANDEELFAAVRAAVSDLEVSDDQLRALIAERAYDATDS